MALALPGVKVGPLDPDRTAEFGQVSASTSARTLIRMHTAAHPPQLVAALSKKLDEERTKALDLKEVERYLRRQDESPLGEDGITLEGAQVRGERDRPQLLTYTFRNAAGRSSKWYADYNSDVLPSSYEDGTENVKLATMRERGIAIGYGDAEADAQRSAASRLRAENEELRARLDAAERARPSVAPGDDGEDDDDPEAAALAAENDELRQQLADAQQRADEAEQERAAAEAEAEAARSLAAAGEQPPAEVEQGAGGAPVEPVEGYDELNADAVKKLLKAEGTSDEDRKAILDYERANANRAGVVSTAEQTLGSAGGE